MNEGFIASRTSCRRYPNGYRRSETVFARSWNGPARGLVQKCFRAAIAGQKAMMWQNRVTGPDSRGTIS
jgi:hypothetical protein